MTFVYLRHAPTIAEMTTSFMSQSPAWMAAIVNGTFSHTMELTHCTADSPSHSKQPVPTAPIQLTFSLRPITYATTKERTRLPANTASILHASGFCACNSAKTGLTFASSLPNTTYHTELPTNATNAATMTAKKFIRKTLIGLIPSLKIAWSRNAAHLWTAQAQAGA